MNVLELDGACNEQQEPSWANVSDWDLAQSSLRSSTLTQAPFLIQGWYKSRANEGLGMPRGSYVLLVSYLLSSPTEFAGYTPPKPPNDSILQFATTLLTSVIMDGALSICMTSLCSLIYIHEITHGDISRFGNVTAILSIVYKMDNLLPQ